MSKQTTTGGGLIERIKAMAKQVADAFVTDDVYERPRPDPQRLEHELATDEERRATR